MTRPEAMTNQLLQGGSRQRIKATSPRWIGWKARPLLRIRYGSEDDGCVIAEGADIRGSAAVFRNALRTTRSTFAYPIPGNDGIKENDEIRTLWRAVS